MQQSKNLVEYEVHLKLDNIQLPIALFEFRNDKIELLRSNCEFDFVFHSQESFCSENKQNVLKNENELFKMAFKEAVKKVTFCIPEYRYELGERYKVLIKYLGNRDETYIMMVIFIDISEYVQLIMPFYITQVLNVSYKLKCKV